MLQIQQVNFSNLFLILFVVFLFLFYTIYCIIKKEVIALYKKIKKRIFEIIETASEHDILSKIFDIFIITLITINIVAVILDTFSLPSWTRQVLSYLEVVSVIIFSIEYVLRVWTADLLYPDLSRIKSRIKYITSAMAIIDLLSILPFYLPLLIKIDLRVLRALRIVRLLRIMKLNRYTNALSAIAQVFRNKAQQLLSSMLVLVILMIISAVLMYNIEHSAQPDEFDNAFSALWWAIATLTTVGYGDIYPVTAAGKILSAVIAFLGVALVAVPTGIISAGFVEQINKKKHFKVKVRKIK